MNERTLFFIKPDSEDPLVDKATALEIISFLKDNLKSNFKRVLGIRTRKLPREFFRDIYSHLNGKYDKLDEMLDYFQNKSIAIFVYEGPNIIRRVKKIAGATRYEDNIGKRTIRRLFGNPDMSYRNIIHASDEQGINHDFEVMKKWKLIPYIKLKKIRNVFKPNSSLKL